jgi:hypothetical protein
MSTATVHHHHRFSHPIAMAAAATIVVLGGASAVGLATSQDGTTPTAPTAPAVAPDACQVNACLPSAHVGIRDFTQRSGSSQPLKGGHVELGTP